MTIKHFEIQHNMKKKEEFTLVSFSLYSVKLSNCVIPVRSYILNIIFRRSTRTPKQVTTAKVLADYNISIKKKKNTNDRFNL